MACIPNKDHPDHPLHLFKALAYLILWIDHFSVGALAEVGVVLEELLIAEVQKVHLRMVECRVHVLIQLTIP